MPTVSVNLTTPIRRTFRALQVAGIFDLPLESKICTHVLAAELPTLDEPWTIGAIVGPSGSGKTTLAKAAFGDALHDPQPWPNDRAIIDCLGDRPIKDLARALTAVGLGSVPTWLKPYRLLSTGERFRADLARAIVGARGWGLGTRESRGSDLVPSTGYSVSSESARPAAVLVIDEFTSTLDRLVAKTVSAALGRLLRRKEPGVGHVQADMRFVAITCHADIVPWLAPDWVLDLGDASGTPLLTRGRVPRPRIALRVERVPQLLWSRFAQYHYLTGGLAASATCYGAWWDEELRCAECGMRNEGSSLRTPHSEFRTKPPIAFCAVVAALGWRKTKRIARLVTLPEFQGLGIGTRLVEAVAADEAARGFRVTITASHPAILAHCSHSPRWRYLGIKKNGSTRQRYAGRAIRCSTGRAVASFEFVAGP